MPSKKKQSVRPVKKQTQNARSATKKQGTIRIISGLWRGRKLPVKDAQGLRPTTDRVKETLFNWIAQDIPNSHCLDLFAGSGGLGFEAASRQAKFVTLIEKDKAISNQLQANITQLNATNLEIKNQDSLLFLEQKTQLSQPYDIVFIDPPFRQGLLDEVIEKLSNHGWLANHAKIYIETEKELTLPPMPANWILHKEKSAGQVCYRVYVYQLEHVEL